MSIANVCTGLLTKSTLTTAILRDQQPENSVRNNRTYGEYKKEAPEVREKKNERRRRGVINIRKKVVNELEFIAVVSVPR